MQQARILILFLLSTFILNAQTEIKVMSYNVLNYEAGANRINDFKTVLSHYTPDLLLLQELKSNAGLQEIVGGINEVSTDVYQSAQFVSQQSSPQSQNKLQQSIIYNTSVFELDWQSHLATNVRDINYYRLFIKDETLSTIGDTTFVYVFVTHMKSSTGSSNEQLRLEAAQFTRTFINNMVPANSHVIVAGDFNIYNNNEPAYQNLVQTGVDNQLIDPFASYGNWSGSSFAHKEILTQSTRSSALSDGAGGGVDDRFDFILNSQELMSGQPKLQYVAGSMKSLGNNGTCYNQNITDCSSGNPVPFNVLTAMYYLSDHIPVVMSLNSSITLSTEEISLDDQISICPNPTSNEATIQLGNNGNYQIDIIDLNGRLIQSNQIKNAATFQINGLNRGTYFVKVTDENGSSATKKLIVQ